MSGAEVSTGWVVVPAVRARQQTVYGVRTRYLQAGAGEPVILLHGGGAGASAEGSWRELLPLLGQHFRVYAPDMLGFGYTDKPLIQYTFQAQVDHLAGFIDALGLERVRVVGSSQGTYIAMKYVLDYPGRVSHAAACSAIGTLSAAAGARQRTTGNFPRFDGSRESLLQLLRMVTTHPDELTDEVVDARYAIASQPGHLEAMDSFSAYRRLLAADESERQLYDVRQRLPRLQVPWCFIWGAEDKTAPLDTVGQAMRELLPNVPLHVVEGVGEHVALERPQECLRLLLDLFSTAPAAEPPPDR